MTQTLKSNELAQSIFPSNKISKIWGIFKLLHPVQLPKFETNIHLDSVITLRTSNFQSCLKGKFQDMHDIIILRHSC